MTWYTKSTDDSKGAVESSFYEESKSVSVSDTKDNLDADSTITIPILTRDYFGKSYICEADNNNSTAPASATHFQVRSIAIEVAEHPVFLVLKLKEKEKIDQGKCSGKFMVNY